MDKVRIGIIGYGHMGTQHSKYLMKNEVPNATVGAVADINPDRLKAAKVICGEDLPVFDSAEALIHSGKVDAIVTSVPHYFHPDYAVEGFKAGLNVMVEKPAGVYTKQVKEMNEVAKKSDKVFGVMFNQRTNPLYQKLRELVKSGELGQIKRTNWIITDWYRSQSYYDQGGWRAKWETEGGGVLLNQNPHNLDLFQWICGMPTRVKSIVYYGKHRDIEVEDDVNVFLEYENGATGSYITTVADAPGTNRFEITGERGKVVVEDGTLTFWRLRESEPEFNSRYKGGLGKPEVWKCDIPIKGKYSSHAGIMQNFCNAIQKGEKLIAPGEEGIFGLEISNAIHLSSWLGESWVDVPIDDELFYQKLMEKCKKQK